MRMPRRPLAGLGYLAVGGTSVGVATLMLTWASMVLVDPAEALEWGTAVTERASNLRGAAAERWAEQYVNPRLAGMLVLFSIIPLWFSRQGLAFAYANLLPLGISPDGLMRVEFSEPPRIGGTVRGRIVLGHKPRPGETFAVKLSCERRERRAIPINDPFDMIADVHVQTQEATARLDDGRWVLDFAFDVPDSIPATPRGFEKLALLLDRSGRGGASWVVQATDAGGEHEIEFDMGRAKMGVAA